MSFSERSFGLHSLFRRRSTPIATEEEAAPIAAEQSGGEDNREIIEDPHEISDLLIAITARSIAASGDHRILLPTETAAAEMVDPRRLRIALCGNMANNAYSIARAMRRLGYPADALISEAFFDNFVMSRPAWEEVEVEGDSYDDALSKLPDWTQPPFVRAFEYDQEFGTRCAKSLSGLGEVRELYRGRFGIELPEDLALLLAQMMGHWPYIAALADYEIAVFMAGSMMLAPFCPIPFVLYPVGGDRFIAPFEESLPGLLTRAAYRRSSAIFMSAPHFKEWYDRLGVTERCVLSDYFIDTDVYCPGEEAALRGSWTGRVGGETFIVSTCRQSWANKGNDRLIRAFGSLLETHGGVRLVFTEWGDDVERSKELASQLGITDKVLWLPLASKPVTARRQRAADIVVDQLRMASFGTCIMESLAAGKPVVARQLEPDMTSDDYEAPPVIAASTEAEVGAALERCLDPAFRRARGAAGRQWMLRWCSHETKAGRFAEQLAGIVNRARAG